MSKELQLPLVRNVLLAALLVATTGVCVAFSSNVMRGYVVLKFCFVAVAATISLWALAAHWIGGFKELEKSKLLWFALTGQAVALALSVFVSGMPWVSLLGSMPRMMGALTYWGYLAAAAGIVVAVGSSKPRFVLVLRTLMVCGVVVSLHALYELPGVRGFRPPGFLGNPDFLGNWLLFVCLSGFVLMIVEEKLPGAILAGAGSTLALIGLTFAQTRGAWLGMAVGTIVFFSLARIPEGLERTARRRTLIWAAASLAVIGILLYSYHKWGPGPAEAFLKKMMRTPSPARLAKHLAKFSETMKAMAALVVVGVGILVSWAQVASRWRGLNRFNRGTFLAAVGLAALVGIGFLWTTDSGRTLRKGRLSLSFKHEGRRIIWRDTVKGMIPKVWHKGCGIETYRVAFLPHKSIDLAINGPKQNWRNPHSVILYELTNNGILGLLAYLAVVVLTLLTFIRARRRALKTPFGFLITGCMASFVAYLTHNLVNYDVVATGYTMYIFVGLAQCGLLAVVRAGEAESEPKTEEVEPNGESKENASDGSFKKRSRSKRKATAKAKAKAEARAKAKAKAEAKAKARAQLAPIPGSQSELTLLYVAAAVSILLPMAWGLHAGRARIWYLVLTPVVAWAAILGRLFLVPRPLWKQTGILEGLSPRKALALGMTYSVLWLMFAVPYVAYSWLHKPLHKDVLLLVIATVLNGPVIVMAVSDGRIWQRVTGGAVGGSKLAVLAVAGAAAMLATLTYCYKHVQADWGIYRAKGYAKSVDREIKPKMNRIKLTLRKLNARVRQLRKNGQSIPDRLEMQISRLKQRRRELVARVEVRLKKVIHNGRMGTRHFPFMGFFHHQYSKSLQPFLREAGTISRSKARPVMAEAVRHATRAVRNNTNPESAYSHLAVIHYWSMRTCTHLEDPGQRKTCQKKRFKLSMAALEKSIGHDRYYYDTHRMKAFLLLREGKIDEAIREIRFSKRIIRNNVRRFANVAKVDTMVKRALLRRGIQLTRKGKWEEAIPVYQRALERYGEPMPEAHHLMGNALMRLKRMGEAEQELELAIRQKRGRFPSAQLDLARLRLLQRDLAGAHRLLRPLIHPRVRIPQALVARAWAYELENRIDEALRDYRTFLRLRPNAPQASRIRAKIQKLSSSP